MSYRGSFVTEYINCATCVIAVREVLLGAMQEKGFEPIVHGRIVSGKVGGLYPSEEKFMLEHELREEIEARICHPIRIAVLCEDDRGDAILRFEPRNATR
jgi:hypothetical protein